MAKVATERVSASVQTEVTVLGSMIVDAIAVMDATALLKADDFQLDSHREIYRAILELAQDNERVDLITVMNVLSRRKTLDSIGGAPYLAYLTEGIPRNPNVESYVRIIRERSLLRQTLDICQDAAVRARDGTEDAKLIITDVEARLAAARAEVVDEPTLEGQVAKTLEIIRRQRRGDQKMYVPSGLSSMDDTHGGFALGETTVIGARSNVGKSTLLRQAVIACAKAGNFCHVMSPEMKAPLLLTMYASVEARVPFRRLRHPEWMSQGEHADVEAALREVSTWPIKIDDTSPLTAVEMIVRARVVKQKHNTKLLGIDYLQKLKYGGRVEHRHVHVTDAIVSLTSFAKNEGVAVVVISSITEGIAKDRNKPPTMSDLRQSGDIQFEADTVILLHRERDSETQKHVPACSMIFDKARSDDTGLKEIYFDSDYIRFVDKQDWLTGLGK